MSFCAVSFFIYLKYDNDFSLKIITTWIHKFLKDSLYLWQVKGRIAKNVSKKGSSIEKLEDIKACANKDLCKKQ